MGFGILPGAVHALQGHPGQLLFIHPGPLSQERRIPRHIQQIIHDLEGDPQMLAVKPAELHRRRVCPRQGQAHFHRRLQEIGGRIVRFRCDGVFEEVLDRLGEMPLPPYIHEKLQDANRYQTVYAKQEGSAAAPTAGLHFTPELLDRIRAKGITVVPVLLHVGLGTFRPVKVENAEEHVMHSEFCQVTPEAAETLNRIRAAGGRIVCVGTTSVRTLETMASDDGVIHPGARDTAIFIYPGVKIKAVDALITNFHLPQSTLLMLVSALTGREEALRVYREAVAERYRFFSFGDAMFIE